MSIELDELDKLAASVFDGYLVRKDLVRKYSRQYPVPTYVVEFLLGRYCASVIESEITEGLDQPTVELVTDALLKMKIQLTSSHLIMETPAKIAAAGE